MRLYIGFGGLVSLLAAAIALPGSRWAPCLAIVLAAVLGSWTARTVREMELRITFLEGTLDAVPQPLTVTDIKMRWVFVNKTTEQLLKRTRAQIRGHHCSEWQAHICNTDKCGIRSLRNGQAQTHYLQDMGDGTRRAMQVDTSYIVDRSGRRLGHVEMVTDVHTQNELSDLHTNLAASLEEMTSTMTEMAAQTKGNADHAAQARTIAITNRDRIHEQTGEIERLNQAMAAIKESSQQITRINKVIDEIAFQTNILALNAAVEAARAGDAGSGFAVVADEVRNLAGRAGEAARQTSSLIEQSTAAVKEGGVLSGRVTQSLAQMGEEARKVDQAVEQIASASAEQSEGIAAVTRALTELGRVALDSAGKRQAKDLVQIARG